MSQRKVLQGNIIIAKAALAAGCDFFAGYPITPSSEIAQYMSKEMPKMERAFIQMEDEIASLGACIGASLAGKKALTATSGPGFSLMQEHLGMAVMAEVPLVIVNVMRGGPSTGMPTKPSQADMMQARWGTHGDHPIIAVYPAFSDEIFSETVRAFNLSEKYWNPVIILLDEVLAKAHMDVEIPDPGSYEVYWEKTHEISDLNIYDRNIGENPPRIDFFHSYPIHIDSLEHDAHGWPSFDAKTVDKMQRLRMEKIYYNLDDIIKYKEYFLDDAEVLVFSFGISARAALAAVKMAREQGIKAGLFQALTVWPFPRAALQERFKKTKKVLTVELNMGQMKYEIERIAPPDVKKQTLLRANGLPFSPGEVLETIKEFVK
ncbi:MAG: 2-oxoacid:acceptor oxidoreductase subunit alpha [Acidobacteria bacterium]|nr:2-oxoacid:acceptor oxidoreductase subunit alpha [Acidobacteriota bacterium]MBU4306584.1 2-oxoacid:acceptor oxidoreductase subunit alpha [Acidobacteriota bacterium]MCG2811401.1 2-oxoacid:acceptor oxidoreductase subunit alpha [Candidatus Aminicenantes bacterium]